MMSARAAIMQLIVDDDVPDRGHRINIYKSYTQVGLACGQYPEYGTITVNDFLYWSWVCWILKFLWTKQHHSGRSTRLRSIVSLLRIYVVATTTSLLNILPSSRSAATSPYVTPPMKYTSTTGRAEEVQGLTLSGINVSPGRSFSPLPIFFQPFLKTCYTSFTQTGAYPP